MNCPHPNCNVVRMKCSGCGRHVSLCVTHDRATAAHRCTCSVPRQGWTNIAGRGPYADHARRIAACVSACAGLADPERDVRDAFDALTAFVSWTEAVDDPKYTESERQRFYDSAIERAEALLARHAPVREAKA